MNKKEVIIELIKQDLIHNCLLQGLRAMGLEDHGNYELELFPVILHLMDLDSGLHTEELSDFYYDFTHQKMEPNKENIEEVLSYRAKRCLEMLQQPNAMN